MTMASVGAVSAKRFGSEAMQAAKQLCIELGLREDSRSFLQRIGDTVWNYAELARHEFRSARFLADELETLGFAVKRGVAGFPTGFVADYKRGDGPVVGLLCEFDALPGLWPGDSSRPGHGCGHNLYAAAALGTARVLREVMEKMDIAGTVRVFGTPSEERLGAKQYYARQGLFDGCCAVFSLHQYDGSGVFYRRHNAFNITTYHFHGKAAHAGSMPEQGRSALDAQELMNVGVQFLREHVASDVRIHYMFTHVGGSANVVPDHAATEYICRAQSSERMADVVRRVGLIAEGAAMMTETTVDIRFRYQYANTVLNRALCEAMQRNMELVGPPAFDEEDVQRVRELGFENGIYSRLDPLPDQMRAHGASTDEGDVSWHVPQARMCFNTAALETPNHSVLMAVQSHLPSAYKSLTHTVSAAACTAVELLTDDGLRKAIADDFAAATAGQEYISDGCRWPEASDFPNTPGVRNSGAGALTVVPDDTILLKGYSRIELMVFRGEQLLGSATAWGGKDSVSILLAEPAASGEILTLHYRKPGDSEKTLFGYYAMP